MQYGILHTDCWNFDETGFRVGCEGSQNVVTYGQRNRQRGESLAAPTEVNRDFLTSVECVSTAGELLPPLLILKAKQHIHQWYNHTHFSDNYYLGVIDSGYSNDFLSLMWLQHFDKYSKSHQRGVWRLLYFDGFGGHTTLEFVEYCKRAKIIPFGLRPHTSQWYQPLDCSCLQPL
jgi:hypothetical protein